MPQLTFAVTQTGSLVYEGQERAYQVVLPDRPTGKEGLPLVIYLHSYGWSAQQGMNYTRLHETVEASNFVFVYPSALPNWNSGLDEPRWPTPDTDDVGFISALIDELVARYGIDSNMVFACGYSNGGFMAHRLACQLSDRIVGIASVAGLISNSSVAMCKQTRPVPTIQIHGTADPWVPVEGMPQWYSVDKTIAFRANNNGCTKRERKSMPDLDQADGSTVNKISYTGCTEDKDVIYFEVSNGGHTWPGAGPPGYEAGLTNQDFNASEYILRFFLKYAHTSEQRTN